MSREYRFVDLLMTVVKDKHLQKIVHPNDETTCQVVLQERRVMEVTVTGLPRFSAIVRVDGLQHLAGIQDGRWKKSCDYLLVIPDGERWWTVLVEMKKSFSDRETAKEQLRRSLPVVRYLHSLCEVEAEKPILATMRHVVLVQKRSARIDKSRTRIDTGVQVYDDTYKGLRVRTIVGKSIVDVKALISG